MTQLNETAAFVATMILNSLLVGIPISAGVSIALKLTTGASPRKRYLLVVISFLAAAVLPIVIALIPARSAPLLPQVEYFRTENSGGGTPKENHFSKHDPVSLRPDSFNVKGGLVGSVDSVARLLSDSSISIALFNVWLIGASLLLGRELTGHLGAARARRAWKPASRDLREHLSWPSCIPLFVDNELGPCALGVFKPTVVMPFQLIDDLSTYAARQVARHELDHLKWRDPLMNTVMRVMRACLWPNLPLWYLERAAACEREAAADRAAIRTGCTDLNLNMAALEYATTLHSIAKKRSEGNAGRQHLLAATEAGRELGLEARIRRLLAVSSRPTHARIIVAVVALFASVWLLAVLPLARVPAQNNQTISAAASSRVTHDLELETARVDEQRREDFALPPTRSARVAAPPRSDAINEVQIARSASVIDDETSDSIATTAARETSELTPALSTNLQAQDLESQMAALGYRNLSPRQLADMKAYAVGPAYVAEMADSGYGGLSADMLIRFKWLAVSSAFIREMKALGYDNLSPGTLAEFRQNGVSSSYIQEMRGLVSGLISAEQLVSLRMHGASTEFVHQIRALGYGRVNAGQLISMRLQGVTVSYIETMRSRGFKELSVDELIGMRMRNNN